MFLSTYIYIYLHKCKLHVYVHIHIYLYVHIQIYIYIYTYTYICIHNICFMRTPHNQIAALLIPAGLQFPTPCVGLRRSPGSAAGGGGIGPGSNATDGCRRSRGCTLVPQKIAEVIGKIYTV